MRVRTAICATLVLLGACSQQPQYSQHRAAIEAHCTAEVAGTGVVDVELDYVPHVVACENGAADFEALRVQAIAARSFLYYKLDTAGSIGDGTDDQVYSCGREPGPEHLRAAEETSGIVLRYQSQQIASFYVAGALQDPPSCRGGGDDPTGTEPYVTYNEGKSGDEIEQTTLGWVDPANVANRGCMSQNGSHCLAADAWGAGDILRFYYGEDIEIEVAEGECVVETDPIDGDGGGGDGGDDEAADLKPPSACATGGGASSTLPLLIALLALRLRRRPSGIA